MKTILVLLQKEFLQISRNRMIVLMIFVMPIIQLLILANAADFEIKNLSIHIIDHSLSPTSHMLTAKFEASPHFNITNTSFSYKEGLDDIRAGAADLILEIPVDFERKLLKNEKVKVHITANAIDGIKAMLGNSYAIAIIQSFNNHIIVKNAGNMAAVRRPDIEITSSNWFNPTLEYSTFMVPGILGLLVTMVGVFLSSINFVKEKEVGTIEQLNVTPIKKTHLIVGKLLPFLIIGLIEMVLGLAVGKFFFDIPMVGSLWLVFGFSVLYLIGVLGLGLLISTISDTQEQAMFIGWFLLMVFILMSGLFTPIESMPSWAQKITYFNPIAYFVDFMRLVLLKGSDFSDVSRHFLILFVFAILMNTFAVWNYRKTTG